MEGAAVGGEGGRVVGTTQQRRGSRSVLDKVDVQARRSRRRRRRFANSASVCETASGTCEHWRGSSNSVRVRTSTRHVPVGVHTALRRPHVTQLVRPPTSYTYHLGHRMFTTSPTTP